MLAWFVTSKLGRALAFAGAVFLFIVTFGAVKKREGRTEAENDALRDSADRLEKGNEATQDLHDAGRDELAAKLHDNNNRW